MGTNFVPGTTALPPAGTASGTSCFLLPSPSSVPLVLGTWSIQGRKGRLNRFEYGGRIYHDAVFFRSAPTSLGWEFLTNYNWLLDWPQERTGFVLRTSEKKQPQ